MDQAVARQQIHFVFVGLEHRQVAIHVLELVHRHAAPDAAANRLGLVGRQVVAGTPADVLRIES